VNSAINDRRDNLPDVPLVPVPIFDPPVRHVTVEGTFSTKGALRSSRGTSVQRQDRCAGTFHVSSTRRAYSTSHASVPGCSFRTEDC
jgi:hypothetical protein